MKICVFIAILALAAAADKKQEGTQASEQNKDKRQTQGEVVIASPAHLVYRTTRRQKEQVAPVEEPQEDDKQATSNRGVISNEYRPGQVFSLNAQELLELQPERKAPVASGQHLQQLYSNDVVPEHKQNLQQFYIFEPQVGRQIAFQPSHAVIARPSHSSNGGEASVGAALSVSDSGAAGNAFDQELLALLGHTPARIDEQRVQAYTPVPQVVTQNNAPQYSQVERYITKPSKKPVKLRPKTPTIPPQLPAAPQQYLIETTNIAQQQPQVQQLRTLQQPRPVQSLRFVSIPATQPSYYPASENEGIKIVAPPKLQPLQQSRGQLAYRLIPQYQPQPQAEAAPKQYRIVDPRPQSARPDIQRVPASSIDRPITYIKRYPEVDKMRSVKLFEQAAQHENVAALPQSSQIIGDHYYIRPIYRPTDQRGRYQLAQLAVGSMDQTRVLESTKSPQSSIYVSQKVLPKKLRVDPKEQLRAEQPREQQVDITSQSLEEQRSHLPPPRNHKAYTPEEFAALVAAGYSVTPIPVSSVRSPPHVSQYAQSRSFIEPSVAPVQHRPVYRRRQQYLPLRGDDAP